MTKNGCKHCGHCCIAYINIPLTKEEKNEGLYASRKKRNLNEWVIMRSKIFNSELGREIFACVYWDPKSGECLIYEDRPQVCRGFDCEDKKIGYYVHAVWKLLKEGKEMECLHT